MRIDEKTSAAEEQKRDPVTSEAVKLHVHDLNFNSNELILNAEYFPNLRNGDLVRPKNIRGKSLPS